MHNPEVFANCLDLDTDFVKDISLILILFRCGYLLNLDRLEVFCKKTYYKHNELYPWAVMSPSMHKLLIHGCDIARQNPDLPQAYLAEDAGETMHSFWKKVLARRARQMSRKLRMQDTFRRGCIFTCPGLSLIFADKRKKQNKRQEVLPAEAWQYLLDDEDAEDEADAPEANVGYEDSGDESDAESSNPSDDFVEDSLQDLY